MNTVADLLPVLQRLALGCVAPAVALSLLPLSFAGAMGGAVRLPLVLALSMMQLGREWPQAWLPVVLLQAVGGLLLGCFLNMLYTCVSTAGSLIDHAGGYSFSMDYAPVDGQGSSPWQSILVHLLTLSIFSQEGLSVLCATLLDTSRLWAGVPDQPFLPLLRDLALTHFPQALAHGVTLAAPVVALLVAIEVGIGTMNRLMPQLNAFALSMALRALVAALALHAAAPALMRAIAALSGRLLAPP